MSFICSAVIPWVVLSCTAASMCGTACTSQGEAASSTSAFFVNCLWFCFRFCFQLQVVRPLHQQDVCTFNILNFARIWHIHCAGCDGFPPCRWRIPLCLYPPWFQLHGSPQLSPFEGSRVGWIKTCSTTKDLAYRNNVHDMSKNDGCLISCLLIMQLILFFCSMKYHNHKGQAFMRDLLSRVLLLM